MNEKIVKLIEKLNIDNKTISTMESCTGGGLANAITNICGASSAINFGAVTYSNDYKVKMGVSKSIIDKYSVYSKETAREMAKAISDYSNSDFGIGITGKLGNIDPNNLSGDNNKVFICIYDKNKDIYYDLNVIVEGQDRPFDKKKVIEYTIDNLVKYV